jgi:hypothetical protein
LPREDHSRQLAGAFLLDIFQNHRYSAEQYQPVMRGSDMDDGMLELIQKILYFVTYIAVGGTVGLIFFLVFAPSILGSRTISKQLEALHNQTEQLGASLDRLAQSIESLRDRDRGSS